jgi:hypothetical protein
MSIVSGLQGISTPKRTLQLDEPLVALSVSSISMWSYLSKKCVEESQKLGIIGA